MKHVATFFALVLVLSACGTKTDSPKPQANEPAPPTAGDITTPKAGDLDKPSSGGITSAGEIISSCPDAVDAIAGRTYIWKFPDSWQCDYFGCSAELEFRDGGTAEYLNGDAVYEGLTYRQFDEHISITVRHQGLFGAEAGTSATFALSCDGQTLTAPDGKIFDLAP